MDMTLKCQIGGATFLTRNMHDQKKENKNRLEALQGFDCVLSIFRVLDDAGWQHVWFTLLESTITPPVLLSWSSSSPPPPGPASASSSPSFFFPRSYFCNRLLFRLLYWSVSRQTRNTKGKSPGPMQVLTRVEEVEKGGCKGGHGCMCQGGCPVCSESGCNAVLEDGGCLSRFGSC